MSIAIRAEGSGKRAGRWQVSLADLSLLVLAAGLAAGVVREATDVWVESARASGVGVEVVAGILALVLARSVLGLARRRPRGGGVTMPGWLAPMAWRALAVVLLISFVLQESEILRINLATRTRIDLATRRSLFWGGVGASAYDVREKLIPVCAILAMFGIVVGMGAGAGLTRPEPRRPRPYWLFVPLAALAGVLFVAVPGIHALGPLYILNVLEWVNDAMRPLGRATSTSLSARLLLAGMEAVPATLTIVGLALIVARDFQRAGRSMPWATTRGGWFVRLLALAAAGAAGIGMAFVAIPTMSPHWGDGFRVVLDPEAAVIVFIGFGTFAAGLAARTVVPRPAWEKPRWLRRLSNLLPLGLMGIVVSSALKCLPSSLAIDPALPPVFAELLEGIEQAGVWFWGMFPVPLAAEVQAWLDPGRLFWILTMVGLALFLSELALLPPALRAPPFDLVGGSPGRLVRFAWLTLGLTVVCLAALPTLIVVGQVILHLRLGVITWTAGGWPSPF